MDFIEEEMQQDQIPEATFQYICRTCSTYMEECYSICDVEMEGEKLRKILPRCTTIQFNINDDLPPNICKDCTLMIYKINRFQKTCRDSQNFFKDISSQSTGRGEIIILKIDNNETDKDNMQYKRKSISGLELAELDSHCESIEDNLSDIFIEDNSSVDTDIEIKDEHMSLKEQLESDNCVEDDTGLSDAASENRSKQVKRKVSKLIGPPFLCGECPMSFETSSEVRNHWKELNHYPKRYKCTYCPQKYIDNYRLQQHVRTHTGEKPNACHICGKRFNHRYSLRRHFLIHSDVKPYKCNECGKGFNRKEFIKDHMRKEHGAPKLLCSVCAKEFVDFSTYSTHQKTAHPQPVKLDKNIPFQCTDCGKILASQEVLDKHLKVHLKKKDKSGSDGTKTGPACPHCQKEFGSFYEVRQHRLTSECQRFLKKMHCEECNKEFITKGAYYAHKKEHKDIEQNKVYICGMCGENFQNHRQYKHHVRKHTRERRYKCELCPKAFYLRRHLLNHMSTHTGERPFMCETCGRSFALKVNLTVHERIHSDVKPVKCEVCQKHFRDQAGCRKHCKQVHGMAGGNVTVAEGGYENKKDADKGVEEEVGLDDVTSSSDV